MKTLLLLFLKKTLFLLGLTWTSQVIAQVPEKDSFVHCIQLFMTDSYTVVAPELLATFPDSTLVETVSLKGNTYYRLMIACTSPEEQIKLFNRFKADRYEPILFIRTKTQVDQMTNLFSWD